MKLASVVLRPGRERSVGLGHPWLLSGSVERVEGDPAPGDVVQVRSAAGTRLGTGDWELVAQIRVRLFAFGKDEVDEDAWLESAISRVNCVETSTPAGNTSEAAGTRRTSSNVRPSRTRLSFMPLPGSARECRWSASAPRPTGACPTTTCAGART